MTSHTDKQAGISLMLAVLVLSAITAIAFSLATIVFIELRSSGDVIRTEPNLYAAFGITEEALFQYKRFVSATDMDVTKCPKFDAPVGGITNLCTINNVTLSLPKVNGVSQPIQFDDTPLVKVIAGGSKIEIPLYQLNNFNKQYGKVQIDILPGATNSLKVSLRKTDSSGVITCYPVSNDCSSSTTVSVGTPYTFTSFDNTGQYDLILDNSTSGNKDLSAEISTFDTNQTTAKGVPFIGQDVLKIVADYLGLSRTYRVQIPLTGNSNGSVSNVALASAGATADGYYSDGTTPGNDHSSACYPAAAAIDGSRVTPLWGSCGTTATNGWNDNTNGVLPDYFQVNFAGTKTISEIDVITIKDAYNDPTQPTLATTFSLYGITDYKLQYWTGAAWSDIPGASVAGNNLVWKQFQFTSISTTKIRLQITGALAGYSRLAEIEAYGY